MLNISGKKKKKTVRAKTNIVILCTVLFIGEKRVIILFFLLKM